MRIAVYDNLDSGGSKREAFEITRLLSQNGHHVDVFTTTAADQSFLPMERVSNHVFWYQWPSARLLPPRLPGIRKYAELGELVDRLHRIQVVARRIAYDIDSGSYDFAFVHHCKPVQGPYLLQHLRTPSVYYCAEPMRAFYEPVVKRPYMSPGSLLDRWQRRWYAPGDWLAQSMIRRADAENVRSATLLLTNSYFSAECIYRAYDQRSLVSYLGVDLDLFRPLNLPRENMVLSVGAVAPLKGYDLLIESLGHIPTDIRPVLFLVGNTVSTSEWFYLQALAEARGVLVSLCKNVSDDELVRLYNSAQAFVYAPIQEPFGLAPLEAMACGTPVVAVAEGGVRESVEDGKTGLLVQRDAVLFADSLLTLLRNKELQRQLGETGVRHMRERWTWQSAYDRFITLVTQQLEARESRHRPLRKLAPRP